MANSKPVIVRYPIICATWASVNPGHDYRIDDHLFRQRSNPESGSRSVQFGRKRGISSAIQRHDLASHNSITKARSYSFSSRPGFISFRTFIAAPMIALLNCSWISSLTLRYQRHPRDPRSFTAGDEIRNRSAIFPKANQRTNLS
jgi:hypothetical protein